MRPRFISSFSIAACAASAVLALVLPAMAADADLPRLEKRGARTQLIVDGKPFIVLGGQVGNPSAFPERMQRAQPAFRAMHLNAIEFPIYWGQIEPVEGTFDFAAVDQILQGLRQQGLRAIPLWFGTYKNGAMDYAPNWVKQDGKRFPRVLNRAGDPIAVLSPHGQATLEADRTAFAALMKHLRETDSAHTVIMVQVENESGVLGSPRDYSADATRLYQSAVPASLVQALHKQPGTWQQVFGRQSEEMFTGYHLSSYINAVARAGKAVYPLPMFVNVWMGGDGTNDRMTEFDRPGDSYPSGGPQSHMIDLWKTTAPDIDIIGPDIYHRNSSVYRMILDRYDRPDNPLLVVETGGAMRYARYCFVALGRHGAIGFSPFGVDRGGGQELSPDFQPVADNFRVLQQILPALPDLQAAGKLQSAIEEENVPGQMLYFNGWDVLVRFRPGAPASGATGTGPAGEPSGRALVGQLGADEFLVAGFDAAVDFKPALGETSRSTDYLRVEEGGYENGAWKTREVWNGNFVIRGLALRPGGTVMRVKLMKY